MTRHSRPRPGPSTASLSLRTTKDQRQGQHYWEISLNDCSLISVRSVSQKDERRDEVITHSSPVLLFTWTAVRFDMIAGGATGATFACVITLRTVSHFCTPWRSVSVLTTWHVHTSPRALLLYQSLCFTRSTDRILFTQHNTIQFKFIAHQHANISNALITSVLGE